MGRVAVVALCVGVPSCSMGRRSCERLTVAVNPHDVQCR